MFALKNIIVLMALMSVVYGGFTLYEHEGYKGAQAEIAFSSGCSNEIADRFNDRAKSISTAGRCVRLCEHRNCQGRCVKVAPDCEALQGCCGFHRNLGWDNCDMIRKISSSSPC
uniref:Beta/gamma crystallin 'Greek key' domain-containing protein n=1 Tax=Rhabditophanes sp. KR3021 TaxID=114890 RepID=A0AC35U2Q4_9BILA